MLAEAHLPCPLPPGQSEKPDQAPAQMGGPTQGPRGTGVAGLQARSHAHTGLRAGPLSLTWLGPHVDTAAASPQARNPGPGLSSKALGSGL